PLTAPPLPPLTWLWLNRLLLTVRVAPAPLTIAPPWAVPAGSPSAWLFASTSLAKVRVLPMFKIPPPPSAPTTMPSLIVKPAMMTAAPPLTAKTRLAWLPLTASWSAPRALDVDTLGDCQRPTGQADGLAFEAGVEDNLITTLGRGEHRT